ncbi:MAG: hypothetical protein Q9165_006022 [Trypethelium subeluteriae]
MPDNIDVILRDDPRRPTMDEDDTIRRNVNTGAWIALFIGMVFVVTKFAGIKIILLVKAICFTLIYIFVLVVEFFRDALDRTSQMVSRLVVGLEDSGDTASNVTNSPPLDARASGTPLPTMTGQIEVTNGGEIPSVRTPGSRMPSDNSRHLSHDPPERLAGLDPSLLRKHRLLERVFYSNATASDYLDPKVMDNALRMLELSPDINLEDSRLVGLPSILNVIHRFPDRLPEQDRYHYSSRAGELMKRLGFPEPDDFTSLASTPPVLDPVPYGGIITRRSDSSIPSYMVRNTPTTRSSSQPVRAQSQTSSRSTASIRSPMLEGLDGITGDVLQRLPLRFSYTNRNGKHRTMSLHPAAISEESEGTDELARLLEQGLEQQEQEQQKQQEEQQKQQEEEEVVEEDEGNRRWETPRRRDHYDRQAAEQLQREAELEEARRGKRRAERPSEHGVFSMLTRSARRDGRGQLEEGI